MKNLVYLFIIILLSSCGDDLGSSAGDSSTSSNTQSGSYANMLVVSGFLYAISESQIITFSLENPESPEEIHRRDLAFGVESMFHRSGILFIGSQESMFIFEIGADGIPDFKSKTDYTFEFELTPCDPVVANESTAIASLSSREVDGPCGSLTINEIRFYDIMDITSPQLFETIAMSQPKGLALDGDYLFVCEANDGLKVFDISNLQEIELIFHHPDLKTFDAIATGSILLVVGPTALYEFDYQDISNIHLVGSFDL